MTRRRYSKHFYTEFHRDTLASARVIVPIAMELLHPRSVVDVGCGKGAFLSVFQASGVEEILGIDGDWLDRRELLIPEQDFVSADLTGPLPVDRVFDLAVCLEVAEHLPEDSAYCLVNSLTGLAPAVLFSAAIPFQGGTGHLNEQWPEYWVDLFDQRGFVTIDCIRKRIWNDDQVAFWYSQNTLLFVHGDLVEQMAELGAELEATSRAMLSVVHPHKYLSSARAIARLRDFLPKWAQRMIFRVLNRC